jgi:hypothetical protein
MSDLELAVIDRLGDPAIESRERRALMSLKARLTAWRRDQLVHFHTRAIVVIERLNKSPVDQQGSGARRPASKRPAVSPVGSRRLKKPTADERRADVALPRPLPPARRRSAVAS